MNPEKKARNALNKLPNTNFGVFQALQAQGIKGHVAEARTCPIARYLNKETGKEWTVSANVAWLTTGELEIDLEEWPNVRGFIHGFDGRAFPELEERADGER